MFVRSGETIIINDNRFEVFGVPMKQFWEANKIEPSFSFLPPRYWRGYSAKWQIIDDKLFLINIAGKFSNGIEINLKTFFPEANNKVFANWFSGTLKISQGKIREPNRNWLIYENELCLEVEKGEIIHENIEKFTTIESIDTFRLRDICHSLKLFNNFLDENPIDFLGDLNRYDTMLKDYIELNEKFYSINIRNKSAFSKAFLGMTNKCLMTSKGLSNHENPDSVIAQNPIDYKLAIALAMNPEKLMRYELYETTEWGYFNGNSIKNIIIKDPLYILLCIINIDYFCTDNLVFLNSAIRKDPKFLIALKYNLLKNLVFETRQKTLRDWDDVSGSWDNLTDWTYYNDNLDMDQQSPEFWNQF